MRLIGFVQVGLFTPPCLRIGLRAVYKPFVKNLRNSGQSLYLRTNIFLKNQYLFHLVHTKFYQIVFPVWNFEGVLQKQFLSVVANHWKSGSYTVNWKQKAKKFIKGSSQEFFQIYQWWKSYFLTEIDSFLVKIEDQQNTQDCPPLQRRASQAT